MQWYYITMGRREVWRSSRAYLFTNRSASERNGVRKRESNSYLFMYTKKHDFKIDGILIVLMPAVLKT